VFNALDTFMLTTSGIVIVGDYTERKLKMNEFGTLKPILDIRCSRSVLWFENKQGWFCSTTDTTNFSNQCGSFLFFFDHNIGGN